MNNFLSLTERVFPLWQPPVGDNNFKKVYVEYVIRNNIFKNNLQFELVDSAKNEFCAAAFFAGLGEHSLAEDWYDCAFKDFSLELKVAAAMCRTYLNYMDEKTFSLMGKDDVKLALFISLKPGSGSILLDSICNDFKAKGRKNIFLWTDCECDWQWYLKHGFELVEEDVYKAYSTEDRKYKTYIFKKEL
ncbi:hypothetical protein [Treponema sp.]|uniref:hypothetical protein n=1 Tax=Treponema sp. TaxID=166 RepID=UPI0025E96FBD|nr:hypothetical protein [Treponema sp.]MCR5217045.1 hypothetical protein [Treponema sp.]